MPPAVRRLAGTLLVLATVLAGCGDDDGPDDAAPTTVAPPGSTIETTTTSAAGSCPEDEPAPGDPVGPARAADLDGDGTDDEVVVTVVDDRSIAVEATYAAGGRTSVVYDDPSVATFAPVRVARVVDVDGDGDDDLWLVVGAGAAVEVVTLVLADGCSLVRPGADGSPNSYAVGASVGFLSGIECADLDDDGSSEGFLEHVAERAEGSTYRGRSTQWFVETEPPALRRGDTSPFVVDVATGEGGRYGELTCA